MTLGLGQSWRGRSSADGQSPWVRTNSLLFLLLCSVDNLITAAIFKVLLKMQPIEI